MERIIGDDHTEVMLSVEEAKDICRMGKGSECCAFLAAGAQGFMCIRMSYPMNASIFPRLKEGTMNAKGEGGWKRCAWESLV